MEQVSTAASGRRGLAFGETDRSELSGDARPSYRYRDVVKQLAVAEVNKRRVQNPRDRTTYREVARQCGVGEQSLRLWVKKGDVEKLDRTSAGDVPLHDASTSDMQAELQTLRRQIQRLRTENEALKRAFVVFSAEWGTEK